MRLRLGNFQKMRLYNVYYLCKQCEEVINSLNFTARNTSPQVFYIENWNEYKKALFTIRQIEFLKEKVDDFYETVPVFVREKARPEIDSDTKARLESKKKIILENIRSVIALYESMNLSENKNGIDVKIPKCDSLATYIFYLKELDFVFTQCPYLNPDEGQILFNTVDVGSQWLEFCVKAVSGTTVGSYILKNLASLVDQAVIIKSHLITLKQQEEVLRNQKLANDVLESNIEMFDRLKKHYLSEAVKAIEAENQDTPLKDGEERARVEKSLEKLCGLLENGVEIYASIDVNRDIQALFPALDSKLELPNNILKFLEDKKEE